MRFALSRALVLAMIAAAALPGITSCSAPRIDPPSPARQAAAWNAPISPAIWPQRLHPTEPAFEVKRGKEPVDEGTFGNCRIYKAGEVKDGIALFVAGRRFTPVREDDKPFQLTVLAKGGTNEIDLKTRDHRITLAVARAAKTAKPRRSGASSR
jgi:hypothetical protein